MMNLNNGCLNTSRMVYQGMLDDCEDYFVSAADLEQAPSIRPPTDEGWERKRKYFGSVPSKLILNTFKYTTQHGILPPVSRLQKRFKSPNPEANATDQISSDTPAMDGGETSAHIFVGQDSKITDVYKVKDNSGKEFL